MTEPTINAPVAVVLAAGKGTRMPGDLPKVVHAIGGRPMVCPVVEACLAAGCDRVIVVVGYKQELVRTALAAYADRGAKPGAPTIEFAVQAEQLGTGHAVLSAEPLLRPAGPRGEPERDVFVLCGDGPLIRAETLRTLLERHRRTGAAATLATAIIDDPSGYGRIVRDAAGRFVAIVEEKNATPEQKAVREVNPSYYCFRVGPMLDALKRVKRNPLTKEYYITDVPALLLADGERVEVEAAVPAEDVLSINTPADLERVDRVYRARESAGVSAGGAEGARVISGKRKEDEPFPLPPPSGRGSQSRPLATRPGVDRP